MPYTQYHPVFVDLNGRRVVIVGGGAVAVEKLESLLPLSGASITVISREVRPEIEDWEAEGRITLVRREFDPSDVRDAFMVIAATDDPATNARVYEAGNADNRLANSVDDPVNCNFIMAAITRKGPMQVAVSSAGCSPALAQQVRRRVAQEILTNEIGVLAEFLGDRRALVKDRIEGYKNRHAFWERVIASDVSRLLSAGNEDLAHASFERVLDELTSQTVRDEARRYESSDAYRGGGKLCGRVYIVGAGPGDPELLTLKAVRALQSADVVLYDRLVNPVILDHAPKSAERIYVGKDLGTPGSGRQRAINNYLVNHARKGLTVVRLKGGDPFVFGRGGEEVISLIHAGIEFEVIPGVSSAIAGPGAANIPVTHRGVSTAFGVFAGQEAEGRSEVPWEAAAKLPTCVFLMGVEQLPNIVRRLIQAGRSEATPVAIISRATLPDQEVVSGTLATIVADSRGIKSPAVIVVGDVVSVPQQLSGLAAEFREESDAAA